MPHLAYRDAGGVPAVLDLVDREVVIGRQPGCDLILTPRVVSRRHARVYLKGGRWVLEDLGSSHGTYVNGTRIDSKELVDGDRVSIGEDTLTFAEGAGARPPVSVATSIPGTWSETSDPEVTNPGTSEELILAEHKVESGELMRTMFGARRADVSQLGGDSSVAQLVTRSTPVADRAKEEAAIAGHLLAIVQMNDELRRATSVEAICRTATGMALRATGATRGVLALRDDSGDLVPVVQIDTRGKPNGAAIRISKTFVEKVVREKVALLAKNTDQDVSLSSAASIVAIGIRSILCAPLWEESEILGYLYLDITGSPRTFRHPDLDLVSAIGHITAAEIRRLRLVDQVRAGEQRRADLARFFSSDVIKHIEEQSAAGDLFSAREQEVTVLFADIVGFTRLSERMTPADVKRFLDDWLGRMTRIIVDHHGGTLDKYIGDAVMALFGAPSSVTPNDDAMRAVAAAVEMRDGVAELRAARPEYADVQVRIGVNTGRVVAGMIGSERRIEYTVIGDSVNVAARLVSLAEPDRILIGPTTRERVKTRFVTEAAGERQLKNREQPVDCWWVSHPVT